MNKRVVAELMPLLFLAFAALFAVVGVWSFFTLMGRGMMVAAMEAATALAQATLFLGLSVGFGMLNELYLDMETRRWAGASLPHTPAGPPPAAERETAAATGD